MRSVPFFIGFVLIIPVTNIFALDQRRPTRRIDGHGVGALLYAEQAILHEAIKDDMCQEAQVFWVGNRVAADPVSRQAISTIMANIRFVSIANAWYRVNSRAPLSGRIDEVGARLRPVSPVCPGSEEGIHAPQVVHLAEGSVLPGRAGLLVTLFGEESGILGEAGDSSSHEMAIVVERYAACPRARLQVGRPPFLQVLSATNT